MPHCHIAFLIQLLNGPAKERFVSRNGWIIRRRESGETGILTHLDSEFSRGNHSADNLGVGIVFLL
jgi:hypothetical protein